MVHLHQPDLGPRDQHVHGDVGLLRSKARHGVLVGVLVGPALPEEADGVFHALEEGHVVAVGEHGQRGHRRGKGHPLSDGVVGGANEGERHAQFVGQNGQLVYEGQVVDDHKVRPYVLQGFEESVVLQNPFTVFLHDGLQLVIVCRQPLEVPLGQPGHGPLLDVKGRVVENHAEVVPALPVLLGQVDRNGHPHLVP